MSPFTPEELPIASIDWKSHVTRMGRANRALAKYEGALYGVPNPAILLAPLTTQEAVLSSRIEGTQASLNDVLQFEADELFADSSKKTDIQEIQNYRRALRLAEHSLKGKPLGLNLLLTMHDTLLDSVRGRDKARGHLRTSQNWIGPEGCTIEQALFVPPNPLDVPRLVSEWERYYHADDLDPLVQLAVVHAQFEIIHPFLDGNGRIGRILVPLFLHEKRVLSSPMFYLSEYLESNRDEYVGRLRDLGNPGAWDRWIDFFLKAMEAQAEMNCSKAKAIQELYDKLKGKVLTATHSQFAIPMLDFIFENPVFNIMKLKVDSRSPSGPMVATLVNKLVAAGILTVLRQGGGRRSGIFALRELVNLCEGRTVLD